MDPILTIGVSLKPQHYDAALACRADGLWFEVHPENYFVEGGPRLACLDAVRARHPISLLMLMSRFPRRRLRAGCCSPRPACCARAPHRARTDFQPSCLVLFSRYFVSGPVAISRNNGSATAYLRQRRYTVQSMGARPQLSPWTIRSREHAGRNLGAAPGGFEGRDDYLR